MMADPGGDIGRAPNGAVAILAAGSVDQRGCGKVKTTVALMAGAFIAAPLLSACNSGTSESLTDIVGEMASQAGSDQVVRVEVEREPELHEGLRVRASFVLEDGTAKQFLKRPYEDDPTSLGSPTPSVLLSRKPAADLDLAGLERRMDELPSVSTPRESCSSSASTSPRMFGVGRRVRLPGGWTEPLCPRSQLGIWRLRQNSCATMRRCWAPRRWGASL